MNPSDILNPLEARIQQNLRSSAPPARTEISPGFYLQIYRGAVKADVGGTKRDTLARYCDAIRLMGFPGVIFHGFPEELEGQWDSLAKLASERNLLALASWGLDSKGMSAQEKGARVARVLAKPTCAAGFLDAEGQWDSDLGAADDMDEAGALALSNEILKGAPGAWVGDQPWYAIEAHGDKRRTLKPMQQGGVFAGFPVDEFATCCTLGRFRQAYIYRKLGQGYGPTFSRMDREWNDLQPELAKVGLDRPLRVTLQAYGWLLHELVHALLDRGVRPNAPLVLWCDPWPDAVCLQALHAVRWMQQEGFAGPGISPVDAVQRAQTQINKSGAGLVPDGIWGAATHRAAELE